MSNQMISMLKLRKIIQQLQNGKAIKQISKELRSSKNTIRKYKRRIDQSSKTYQEILSLNDEQLCNLLECQTGPFTTSDDRYPILASKMESYAKELKKPGVTKQTLWEEYRTEYPIGYRRAQFCEHITRYLSTKDLSIQIDHKYGDVLEVDFAGKSLSYIDKQTGEFISCPTLVCTLSASKYFYVEALPDASQEQVYACLSRALEYFGGVPKNILSDNMKQYVIKSNRYEPQFNDVALEWSTHYQTNLQATRVRHPKDKASVEGTVNNAYYRIYAPLRNMISYSLEELNENVKKQLIIANNRPFQKREGCRFTDFISNEKDLLFPLPAEPYVYKHKINAKVRKDYHIILGEDKNLYSVPYQYVGQTVVAVYDTTEVAIYLNMKQIAVHKRSYGKYKHITCKEHLHPRHLAYKEQKGWDSDYFLNIMTKVGPNSKQITQNILTSRTYPEQSFSSCCGLIKLLKAYGNTRFENACTRALLGKTHTYLILKNILEKNLDKQLSITFNENYIPNHENIRGHKSYL
jgi:transposase